MAGRKHGTENGLVILAFQCQIHFVGGRRCADGRGCGDDTRVGLTEHFVDVAIGSVMHREAVGRVLRQPVFAPVDAVGSLRLHQVDGAFFQGDDCFSALERRCSPRQSRPGR